MAKRGRPKAADKIESVSASIRRSIIPRIKREAAARNTSVGRVTGEIIEKAFEKDADKKAA